MILTVFRFRLDTAHAAAYREMAARMPGLAFLIGYTLFIILKPGEKIEGGTIRHVRPVLCAGIWGARFCRQRLSFDGLWGS